MNLRLASLAATLLLSAGAFAAPQSAREDALFRGSGVIRTTAAGEVVISMHSFGKSDDVAGEVDHEFRFWSEAPLPRFDVAFRAAFVDYRGHELAIVIADTQAYYGFVIDGAQQTARTIPAGYTGATFVGYGLNHSNRRGDSRIVERGGTVDVEMIYYPDYGDGGGSGSTTCDSGGVGSTSCSATNNTTNASCSVSCGTGYYACCNKGSTTTKESCKCVPR